MMLLNFLVGWSCLTGLPRYVIFSFEVFVDKMITIQAAMAEMLADWDHNPTPDLIEAYNQWGQGGWGAILTGQSPLTLTLKPDKY